MNNIIQQIAVKMVEQVLENLSVNGLESIGQTAHQLLDIAKSTASELLSAAIQQMDIALVNANKARKEDGLRIKQRNVPRTLLTDLGEVRYTRTYFETREGDRCYLVDHLIGVEPYERLSKELCAQLVQQTANKSLESAAKDMHGRVSRQTVDNKLLALKQVATEAVRAQETPKALHLFADEDHVHLKNGRSAIVPLVTVTEGIDASHKRHQTIHPIHFEGYGIHNECFFENIRSFLNEQYRMEQVETVYVHGDGGAWIRAAKDWLPNVRFVMDGFHLEKRLRQISRLEGAAPYTGAIRQSLREDQLAKFIAYCSRIHEKLDERGRETLRDHVRFIRKHWREVVLRMQNNVCGSCTEPLVSHVLAQRLSRNPIAWSEHGVRQMAMLRVYVQNGGVVTSKDIRVSRSKAKLDHDRAAFKEGFAKYRAYADNQMDAFLNTKLDWSFFDQSFFRSGKLDGVAMIRKAYGSLRNSLSA